MRIMLDTGTSDRLPGCWLTACGGSGGPSWQSETEVVEAADAKDVAAVIGTEGAAGVPPVEG